MGGGGEGWVEEERDGWRRRGMGGGGKGWVEKGRDGWMRKGMDE